jgi:pyruvate formate lyase activating enzyme
MHCKVCELHCHLSEDYFGHCGMYVVKDGEVVPRYENQLSSFTVARVEDVPLLHYYPGLLTLTLGTVSCNFDCYYCVNSRIACKTGDKVFRYSFTPQEIVDKAKQLNCQAVAFTVNEPAVSFPYFFEVAMRAREASIKSGCATNGYFTEGAVDILADYIDFANISLKSWRDEFYQKSCGVAGIEPVLRNIKKLYEKGVHIEVTTPVTPDMDIAEIEEIARFLGSIDRKIPWHLFWLLAEYKAEAGQHVPVNKLVEMRKVAKKYLDYVFIGNLVGSEWLDTECPGCGYKLVGRINTFGCGAQLAGYDIKNGKCPQCGRKSDVIGEFSLKFKDTAPCEDGVKKQPEQKPALGLLEIYGSQKLFDFKTGKTATSSDKLIGEVGNLIKGDPYPGDGLIESDDWVTRHALRLTSYYEPDIVMLNYSQPWFVSMNNPEKRIEAVNNALSNAHAFVDETGYTPLIVGLGGFEKVETAIPLEEILKDENIIVFNGKSAIFKEKAFEKLSTETLERLLPHWDVFSRDEILSSVEPGYNCQFEKALGDYVAFARPGVCFKGASDHFITHGVVPALEKDIPVFTSLNAPEYIWDAASVAIQAVNAGQKVALILVEGAGKEEYTKEGINTCRNNEGNFIYQLPYQYMSVGSGRPYSRCEYQFPLGEAYWMKDYRSYPFSRRFNQTVYSAMRREIAPRKSLSVGNRNIMTHVCFEADIVVECYSCIQHHFATMAVFY